MQSTRQTQLRTAGPSARGTRAALKLLPALAVAACGLLLSYPAWRHGLSTGGDSVFHSMWYTHFARQFAGGEPYPRWLHEMNGGLGSPVFFYYAPLPYYATLLFSPFLAAGPHGLAHLGASASLAVVGSGLCAYLWLARVAEARSAAAAGAVFYMLAPYHLGIDLYERNAFAEVWAFVWMPLTLYFTAGLGRGRARAAPVGLALGYAALALTHLPATLLFSAVPPAYALCRGGGRALRLALAAMLLGAGAAAVYLLPALTTQEHISTADFTAAAYHTRWLRFPGFALGDLDARIFWASVVTSALAVCAYAAARMGAPESRGREPLFWLSAALAGTFLMTPLGGPVWRLVTTLQSVQFPWRFNLIVCVAAAVLVAHTLVVLSRPLGARALPAAACALLLLACASHSAHAVWTAGARARAAAPDELFQRRFALGRDATEYRPTTAASIHEGAFESLLARLCKSADGPARACVEEGEGAVAVTLWRPREIGLRVESTRGLSLVVNQFHYPGWEAEVDASPNPVEPSRPDGLLRLSVPAGARRVRLRLRQSRPEVAGKIVSAASLLLLALWAVVLATGRAPRRMRWLIPQARVETAAPGGCRDADAPGGGAGGLAPSPAVGRLAAADFRAALRGVGALRRRPVVKELLILLAYAALTAVMTWPWVSDIHDAVHDLGDAYTIAYNLWWGYHQTFNDPLHLFDATIFYPHRDTLAFSEHDYGIALLFFPLFALGARPLTVHSVATLSAFLFSGYGAFRLTRTLTGSYGAAWIAGVVFAFIPYRFHRLPHLHYIFAGWLPLLFEALVLYARRRTWRRAVWLAAAFLMNAITCLTWFVLSLLPLGLFAAYLVTRGRLWRSRVFWWRAAAAFGPALPVLVFFMLPYQRVASAYNFVRRPEDVLVFSATPGNWLMASWLNKLWRGMGGEAVTPELYLFPGFLPPLLALAALLLVAPVRRGASERAADISARLRRGLPPVLDALAISLVLLGLLAAGYGTFRLRLGGFELLRASHPARAFVAALAVICARLLLARPHAFGSIRSRLAGAGGRLDAGVLAALLVAFGFAGSFGPRLPPYRWLMEYVWIYQSQRVPARWAMLCYLGLAVAAGLGAGRVAELAGRRLKRARPAWVYAALACALLFEQRVAPLPYVRGRAEPDELALRLRRTPMRGGLVELPTDTEGIFYYVLRAADHGRPVVTATSSFLSPTMLRVEELSRRRPVPDEFVDLLESIPASYLAVHYRYLTPERARAVESMLINGIKARRLRFIRSYQNPERADLYAVVKTEPEARAEGVARLPGVLGPAELFAHSALPPDCRETGFFVYRLYRAAYGRAPTYEEFRADVDALAGAARPGEPGWETRLAQASGPFVEEWVGRPAFRLAVGRLTPRQWAVRVRANTGEAETVPTAQEVKAAGDLDRQGRAAQLLRAIEDEGYAEREFDAAWVALHYFGLLRRDPDEAGAEAWLRGLSLSPDYITFSRNFAATDEARAKRNAPAAR